MANMPSARSVVVSTAAWTIGALSSVGIGLVALSMIGTGFADRPLQPLAPNAVVTDSPDGPITSPDFLDQPVLVTPNHIVRVKENEALSGSGNESAASQSFERSLLLALLRFKAGDFTARLPGELIGLEGKIADAFNDILIVSERRASETARVCRVVGKEDRKSTRLNSSH